MHTFEAAYARIQELSKQVEALTNEKYQLMVERDDALHEVEVRDSIYEQAARTFVNHASLRIKYERQRRTIRALVVAARAIHRTLWSALDQYEVNDRGIEREMRQHVIGLRWEIQQAERGQAKE